MRTAIIVLRKIQVLNEEKLEFFLEFSCENKIYRSTLSKKEVSEGLTLFLKQSIYL